MESVPELLAAGATDVHVTLRAFNGDPADAPAVFAEIVRRFADVCSMTRVATSGPRIGAGPGGLRSRSC